MKKRIYLSHAVHVVQSFQRNVALENSFGMIAIVVIDFLIGSRSISLLVSRALDSRRLV